MSTCRDIEPLLSPFIDGQLAADDRDLVVTHLDTCGGCRGLAADLERMRSAARVLGPVQPPVHLWLEIAGRIRLEEGKPVALPRAAGRALPQWLGLAAALLLVTFGVYLVDVMRTPGSPGSPVSPVLPVSPPPEPTVQDVARELRLALEHYDNAIASLQAIAQQDQVQLDPQVAATLSKNLTVIDRAIADSRAALTTNPDSEPARETLLDALRRKVDVLQTTVAMMNEMRKGDAAGAARVAGGKS